MEARINGYEKEIKWHQDIIKMLQDEIKEKIQWHQDMIQVYKDGIKMIQEKKGQ